MARGLIDVRGVDELRGIAAAMQLIDKPARAAIRSFTRSKMVRPWQDAISADATTLVEQRAIAGTSRVVVGDLRLDVTAATRRARFSGGLDPREHFAAVEFGGDRGKVREYRRRSRNGGSHTVRRHTARQLRPRGRGYVFNPAAHRMAPRLASLWVQTMVKGIANVIEGRGF